MRTKEHSSSIFTADIDHGLQASGDEKNLKLYRIVLEYMRSTFEAHVQFIASTINQSINQS